MIGLTAVLDMAKPGDRILMVSYGSGAGSDAFSTHASPTSCRSARRRRTKTLEYIARRTPIDYATYIRYRDIIAMK